MSQEPLLTTAARWHPDSRAGSSSPVARREVPLPSELRPGLALVIQGVRRCGKSTLLDQLVQRYGLDPSHCVFLNFEDPRLAGSLDHTVLEALVEAAEAEVGDSLTFFLDEIQNVDGWERWLRAALDRQASHRFVVTGSNAHLLSGELASRLTGRHLTVELFPFSIDEFREVRPDATVLDYLENGGFPAPLLVDDDGDSLRRSYFNGIVERDVRERVGARSVRPLRQLTQMLFEAAGSELSVRRAAGAIGMAPDTTGLYLEAIESAYLAFGCPFFAWSERKRSVRNKKYYPIDTGLRRVSVTKTGDDRGKMLECATFVLLRKRFGEVFYWRGRKGEVDFVVLRDGDPVPIQVSWEGPLERHGKALDEFYGEHPRGHEAVFVTAESYEAGAPDLTADAD